MGFEVSRHTANKLRGILAKGLTTDGATANGTGTGRHDLHVRITGPEVAGLWPCVPTYYDPVALAWVEFDTQRAKAANGGELELDRRYRAICYGVATVAATEYLLFAVDESAVAGCGLTVDDDGQLMVDVEQLAGCGLKVEDDDSDSDSCDRLAVDVEALAGCGLLVDDSGSCDRLAVDPEALAGTGLEVDGNEPGCTGSCHWIWIGEDGPGGEATWSMDADATDCSCTCAVRPDYDGTTPGETAVTPCGYATGGCGLKVKPGCHVAVDSAGVSVTPGTLAGGGLKVEEDDASDSDTCTQLAVNPACGLYVDDDGKLALDVETVFTGCFIALNNEGGCPDVSVDVSRAFHTDIPFLQDVTIGIAGCTGTVTKTPRILRIWENGCGMLTGAEVLSAEATTTNFSIGCCCDSDSGPRVGMMAEMPTDEPVTVTPAQQPPLNLRRLDG